MTANQINYARHLEDVRHNQETEAQGRQSVRAALMSAEASDRSSRASETSALEGIRHNREQESINWWSAQETGRHNLAGEAQAQRTLNETKRHNTEQERVSAGSLAESIRSNLAKESVSRMEANTHAAAQSESARANRAQESLRSRELSQLQSYQQGMVGASQKQAIASLNQSYASMQNAQSNSRQADIARSALSQTIVQNRRTLQETSRHNQALESIQAEQAAAQSSQAVTAAERAKIAKYEAQTRRGEAVIKGFSTASQVTTDILRNAGSILPLLGG